MDELVELMIEKDAYKVTIILKEPESGLFLKEELYGVDHVEKEGLQVVTKRRATEILTNLRNSCKDAFSWLEEEDEVYEEGEEDEDDSSQGLPNIVLEKPSLKSLKHTQASRDEGASSSYVTPEPTEENVNTLNTSSTFITDEDSRGIHFKEEILKDKKSGTFLGEEIDGVGHVEGSQVLPKMEATNIQTTLGNPSKDAFSWLDEDEDDDEIYEEGEEGDEDYTSSSSGQSSANTVLKKPILQSLKQTQTPRDDDESSYVSPDPTEPSINNLTNTSSFMTDENFNEFHFKKELESKDCFYKKSYDSCPGDWAISIALVGTAISLLGFMYVIKLYRRISS